MHSFVAPTITRPFNHHRRRDLRVHRCHRRQRLKAKAKAAAPATPGFSIRCSTSIVVHGYSSRGDPPSLAFVLLSYLDLLTLCFVLLWHERLGPESAPGERARLKATVWALSVALMAAFGHRAAEATPPALAAAVWLVAGDAAVGRFYGFFCYEEKDDEKVRRG